MRLRGHVKRRPQTPVRDGNQFTLHAGGREFYPRMLAAIDASRYYVLAEFYLVESGTVVDRFISALSRAAGRGVSVRLLLDAFGARGLSKGDRTRLAASGMEAIFYNAPRSWIRVGAMLRDHRKLLLVDGKIGFTGGAGLSDHFLPEVRPESYWWDCMLEIRGPVLDDWHGLFGAMWRHVASRDPGVPVRSASSVAEGVRGRVVASAGLSAGQTFCGPSSRG
jgi:cardiolipin synthase A/B